MQDLATPRQALPEQRNRRKKAIRCAAEGCRADPQTCKSRPEDWTVMRKKLALIRQFSENLAGASRSGNFHSQLFWQPVTNFLREPVVHVPRTHPCNFYHGYRSGSSHRDNQPDQSRQREPSQRRQFQNKSMLRPEVANHTKGQQEDSSRNRR